MTVSTSRPIAEALADVVVARGADRVFGFPGGGTNLEVIGACADRGLPFVLTHAEGPAMTMASVYGFMTGRPALAIAGRGPGCANSVNGVAGATLDRMPLVLCTDGVPSADTGRIAHQQIDQVGVMAPVTKWSGVLGLVEPQAVAEMAFELAGSAPAGAVHMTIDPTTTMSRVPFAEMEAISDAGVLAAAANALGRSRRPVAIVGNGALGWADQVDIALVRLGCPVLATYQGVGIAPNPTQFAGLYTGGELEESLLDDADLIVAIGLDPVEPIPGPWRTAAPVISFCPSPLHHRYWPEFIDLVGPVGPMIRQVVATAPEFEWDHDEGRRRYLDALAKLEPDPVVGLGPVDVVTTVAAAAPARTLATVDAGAHFLAVMPWWRATEPRSLLISNGLATMGFALPAAMGMALARPGRPVVCFVGDGGLSMVLGELETLARLALPVTVVVLDDATLSLIQIKQGPKHGGPKVVRYLPTDFAGIARAVGLPAVTVDNTADLAAALVGEWDHPRLIHAHIDPSGYRHLLKVTRG